MIELVFFLCAVEAAPVCEKLHDMPPHIPYSYSTTLDNHDDCRDVAMTIQRMVSAYTSGRDVVGISWRCAPVPEI